MGAWSVSRRSRAGLLQGPHLSFRRDDDLVPARALMLQAKALGREPVWEKARGEGQRPAEDEQQQPQDAEPSGLQQASEQSERPSPRPDNGPSLSPQSAYNRSMHPMKLAPIVFGLLATTGIAYAACIFC